MHFLLLYLSLHIGLAACAHAGGGRHALFHKREEPANVSPAADIAAPTSSASSTTETASKTSSAASKSSSSSTATASSSTASDTPNGSGSYTAAQKPCGDPDSKCKREAAADKISEKSSCYAEQRFDWNVTSFYPTEADVTHYGFGNKFTCHKDWYKDCSLFMPNTMTVGGRWDFSDAIDEGKFAMLEAAGRCGLQISVVGKSSKISMAYNDVYFAARDALPVLEAAAGRFGIGGSILCDVDQNKDTVVAWRLTPKMETKNEFIDRPYEDVDEPWVTPKSIQDLS